MARAERQVPFGAAFDAAVGKSFPRNFVTWKFWKYIFLAEKPIEIQHIHQHKKDE